MRDEPYSNNPDPYFDPEQAETTRRRAMLLGLLRGRWHWALLLAVLLGTAGGYLGFNSQKDMYQALSTIDIKPNYISAVQVTDLSVYEPYVNFVNGEIRRLRSPEVVETAMGQPEWQDNLAKRPADMPQPTLRSFTENIGVSEPGRNETLLYVSFTDEDPGTARAGLNAVLTAYREAQKQSQVSQNSEQVRLLEDQKRKLELDKAAAEDQRRLIVPDQELNTIRSRLNSKLSELARYESKLSEIELILKPYKDIEPDMSPEGLRRRMLQDPQMLAMLDRRNLLEQRVREMTEVQNLGAEHNLVRQARRGLTVLDRDIADFEAQWMSGQHQAQIPPEVQNQRVLREGMLSKIEELNAEIDDLSGRLTEVTPWEEKVAALTAQIEETASKIEDFKSSRSLVTDDDVSRIEIGPPAATPIEPSNAGKRRQLAGVGAIGGFFLGFGMVMAVGIFDRRLRHVSDTAIGMPDANVLGILPTLPADLRDPEDAETAAHCVHHIRTLLQIGGANRVFSVTSPSAGSGKSSLSTALGMSFAASGTRTLVIDCDLVGAGLSRRMGTVVHEPLDAVIRKHRLLDEVALAQALTLSTTRGRPLDEVLLSENLMDQEQLEVAGRLQRDTALGLLDACVSGRLRSCVAAGGIDNLYILPVGKARPADASKLSPAAIRELIRQAREAFDIVLIDTGPVLGSLEASIAAAEADATILIVSRGDQKSLAARTLAQLRSVRANIAGIVFNHALDRDLAHTSYASVVSQERRPDRSQRKQRLDKTRSARLGPLGTAVASYIEDGSADHGEAGSNGNGEHHGNGLDPGQD